MAEVEELVKRIAAYPGVQGCLVVSHDGIAVRTTLDNNITVQYAALIQQLTTRARATVRDIEPQDDLVMLRIRTSTHELMIAPDKDFMLVVIQDPKTN